MVTLIDSSIVNDRLWRFNHFLDVFESSGSLSRLTALILSIDISVDLLSIRIGYTHGGPIFSDDLTLEAKFAMAHRPDEVHPSLSGILFLLSLGESLLLDGLRVDYLGWREILEDVILDLENVNGKFFVESLSEFLRQEYQ